MIRSASLRKPSEGTSRGGRSPPCSPQMPTSRSLVLARRPARFHGHLDQLADTFLVENRERIVLENLRVLVILLELSIVVARETHGGLREVVGAEAEELGLLGDQVGGERGARDLDHG